MILTRKELKIRGKNSAEPVLMISKNQNIRLKISHFINFFFFSMAEFKFAPLTPRKKTTTFFSNSHPIFVVFTPC